MGKIGLFCYNLFYLVKAMAQTKLGWRANWIKITDSDLDPKTKVYYPIIATNLRLGKGSYISANANISNTTIGKFCSIGPNFMCGWGTHPISGISTSPVFYSTRMQAGFTYAQQDKIEEKESIVIGNDVFIGANVTVLNGVTIGDGAVIGAGAVVSKNIPPYAIAVGCPIKIMKYRFEPGTIEKLLEYKWWDRDEETHMKLAKNFFDVEEILRNS